MMVLRGARHVRLHKEKEDKDFQLGVERGTRILRRRP